MQRETESRKIQGKMCGQNSKPTVTSALKVFDFQGWLKVLKNGHKLSPCGLVLSFAIVIMRSCVALLSRSHVDNRVYKSNIPSQITSLTEEWHCLDSQALIRELLSLLNRRWNRVEFACYRPASSYQEFSPNSGCINYSEMHGPTCGRVLTAMSIYGFAKVFLKVTILP